MFQFKPKPGDSHIDYRMLSQQYRDNQKHNNVQFDSRQFSVMNDGTGVFVSLSQVNTTPDLSGEDFAILKIDNKNLQVTINAGNVVAFAQQKLAPKVVVSVGGTKDNPQYIYVGGSTLPGSFSAVIGATSVSTYPVNDATSWKRCLYNVYLDNAGNIQISRSRVIDLTSYYDMTAT